MRLRQCGREGCYAPVFTDGECRLHILEMMDLESDWTPLDAPPDPDDPGSTIIEMREPSPAKRCDACAAGALWVVEIMRVKASVMRQYGEVAVFRLCTKHAENVTRADPRAAIHGIRGSNG